MKIFIIFSILVFLVSGCGSGTKKALGLTKQIPDEFAIVTNTPLVVPPEFDLINPLNVSSEKISSQTEEKAKKALQSGELKSSSKTEERIFKGFDTFSALSLEDVNKNKDEGEDLLLSLNSKSMKALDNNGDDELLQKFRYDVDIRKKITDDYDALVKENDTFIKNLLFWQKDNSLIETPIDAFAEKERINKEKALTNSISSGIEIYK